MERLLLASRVPNCWSDQEFNARAVRKVAHLTTAFLLTLQTFFSHDLSTVKTPVKMSIKTPICPN